MKKVNLVLWIGVLFLLLISSQSFSWIYVCVDPGHGGSDDGCTGRIYGVKEKNVNLGVGLAAYTYLIYYGWWPMMTRTEDVTLYPPQRADTANKANGGYGVDAFVSIHHNADSLETDTITNGTETFWCNAAKTDSNWDRNITDTLARKVYCRLRDQFHYHPRGVKHKCWDVLRLTKMASTLSEASFLTCAAVERKFYYNFNEECGKEGEAIFHGCSSYLRGFGIVTVTYAYEGGYYGQVIIDFEDTVTTPFVTCWEGSETHFLTCKSTLNSGGHTYTFNHWNHEWGEVPHDPNNCWWEPYYDTTWYICVPWEHDHNYYAYMTGAPYSVTVISPNGWEEWHVAEQHYIHWNASPGADSSSKVDICISRDGGSTWSPIAWDLPYDFGDGGYYLWTVTGPVSTHCRIKITADDCAQNNDFDISNYDFSISGSGNNNPVIDTGLHCRYPYEECNDCIKYGESYTLEVNAHDPDGDSIYYEWYCPSLMGGHFPNGQDTMTTAENYVVWTAPARAKAESPAQDGDALENEPDGFLSVTVVDIRGGSNFACGYFGIYDPATSCLCGDCNGDGAVNLADAVCIVGYLYFHGPQPLLMETGDVNNDCVLNIADAVYIVTYLFQHGPLPVCGWICPPDLKTPNSVPDDQTSGKVTKSF